MPNREAARNEVAQVIYQVATALERTAELLRTQLITPVPFVLPPGMLYWGSAFQLLLRDVERSLPDKKHRLVCSQPAYWTR